MNMLLLGNMMDKQTGCYISSAFKQEGHKVAFLDIRAGIQYIKREDLQVQVLDEIKKIKWVPDLILVLKGLELDFETLKKIKELVPSAKLVNWFFDEFLMDKPIWEQIEYFETFKLFDYYFCSLNGVAEKLKEAGLKNVQYLEEGCDETKNGEVYTNNFQKRKYGSDIAFCGNLGFAAHANNRIKTLQKLVQFGFNLKIWGNVMGEWKQFPKEIKDVHQQIAVINEQHSMVSQSSLINLGIDQNPDLDMGFSARAYRVMCAGGLYLNTATKGLEKLFKINKTKDAPITEDLEMVVYYDLDDLINKCDFLLKHEDVRQKIAKNGQKVVLENHTFRHRVCEMLSLIK